MSTGSLTLDPGQPGGPAARRRHRVWRGLGATVGWLAALGAAAGLTGHFLDSGRQSLVLLAAGAWLLVPLSVLALVLHLWRRARVAVLVALTLLVVQVVVYAPLFVAATAPTGGTTLRVLTQNTLYGRADAAQIVARVRAGDVDVLMVEEMTTGELQRLDEAGLAAALPYRWARAEQGGYGSGLFSRYPLSSGTWFDGFQARNGAAVATLPGGGTVTLVVVHLAAPFPDDPARWQADLPRLHRTLQTLPSGPVVVAGDFNATWDHAPFRALLTGGYRDGAEQAGAGFVRSWPANRVVPVIGIDHVLTRGAVATSFGTVATSGSDHRGAVATVVVPR